MEVSIQSSNKINAISKTHDFEVNCVKLIVYFWFSSTLKEQYVRYLLGVFSSMSHAHTHTRARSFYWLSFVAFNFAVTSWGMKYWRAIKSTSASQTRVQISKKYKFSLSSTFLSAHIHFVPFCTTRISHEFLYYSYADYLSIVVATCRYVNPVYYWNPFFWFLISYNSDWLMNWKIGFFRVFVVVV